MKKAVMVLASILVAGYGVSAWAGEGGGCCGMGAKNCPMAAKATTQPAAAAYVCPMCPDVKSDKPGKCPHCGMDLVPANRKDKSATTQPAA